MENKDVDKMMVIATTAMYLENLIDVLEVALEFLPEVKESLQTIYEESNKAIDTMEHISDNIWSENGRN